MWSMSSRNILMSAVNAFQLLSLKLSLQQIELNEDKYAMLYLWW